MKRGLFARLTGASKRGGSLFESAVAEARQPHWFTQGAVPDTVEGRFAVLATVVALLIVRLEQDGPHGEAASVALTERFVEAMDAEIRQMGVSDPGLGKQVRSLIGALAARLERWRSAVAGGGDWTAAVIRSLYRDAPPDADALGHGEARLRELWSRLQRTDAEQIAEGKF